MPLSASGTRRPPNPSPEGPARLGARHDSLLDLLGNVEKDNLLALGVQSALELGERDERRLHRTAELASADAYVCNLLGR